MVIKTVPCAFSEFKLYPGHGSALVRRDGVTVRFFNSKSKSLYLQKKKPAKLSWTTAWRILHKKGQSRSVKRRTRRRKARIVRKAIAGVKAEDIRARVTEKAEDRKAKRDAALRYA